MTKITHKQNVPTTSRKWSIHGQDLALLKAGFFFQQIEKEAKQQ